MYLKTMTIFSFTISVLSSKVCPTGWARFKRHCYRLFPQQVDWSTAKFYCISQSSSLLSLQSETEWNFVVNDIIKNSGNTVADAIGVWTGGYTGPTDKWTWYDNSPFQSLWTKWAANQPNGVSNQCMYLRKEESYQWAEILCDRYTLPFICKTGDGKL